ncbi:MAG: hypothetical protein FWG25_10060, partial [Promicromonosporaceae bacterium]|nr:hypothetical protein [Promicromonosporaceae bacterium]
MNVDTTLGFGVSVPDIPLPGDELPLVLLTLTGPGHHTFATSSLEELGAAFAAQERRARAGEIAGLAITG